jgi:hypothetical protein
VAPTATGAPGVTRVAPGNQAVQQTNRDRANVSPRENAAATNASPTGVGRPAANAHLDSSRFAHPGANTATPSTGVAPNRGARDQGSLPAVQHGVSPNNDLRSSRNTGEGMRGPGSNAQNAGNTGQNAQQYHQASPVNRSNTQDYRTPQVHNNNQRPTAQEYRGQTNNPRPAAQDYRAPQSNNNPRPAAQEYRAPQSNNNPRPAAQEYRAPQTNNNPRSNGPQESQRAAPASQMMQQQRSAPPAQVQQQRVAPPPPQQQQIRMPPPQPTRAPPSQPQPPKDKKDEDKRHGGG